MDFNTFNAESARKSSAARLIESVQQYLQLVLERIEKQTQESHKQELADAFHGIDANMDAMQIAELSKLLVQRGFNVYQQREDGKYLVSWAQV